MEKLPYMPGLFFAWCWLFALIRGFSMGFVGIRFLSLTCHTAAYFCVEEVRKRTEGSLFLSIY